MPMTALRQVELQEDYTRGKLIEMLDTHMQNVEYMIGELRRGKPPRDKGLFIDDIFEMENLNGSLGTQLRMIAFLRQEILTRQVEESRKHAKAS